jgi:hypothetical protein
MAAEKSPIDVWQRRPLKLDPKLSTLEGGPASAVTR